MPAILLKATASAVNFPFVDVDMLLDVVLHSTIYQCEQSQLLFA